jgi:hypothetical protein
MLRLLKGSNGEPLILAADADAAMREDDDLTQVRANNGRFLIRILNIDATGIQLHVIARVVQEFAGVPVSAKRDSQEN